MAASLNESSRTLSEAGLSLLDSSDLSLKLPFKIEERTAASATTGPFHLWKNGNLGDRCSSDSTHLLASNLERVVCNRLLNGLVLTFVQAVRCLARALMWAGPTPQHPPTMFTPSPNQRSAAETNASGEQTVSNRHID